MRNIVIYANGSAGNHGCEALTRSINAILRSDHNLKFASLDIGEDSHYGLEKIVDFVPLSKPIKKDWRYLLYLIAQKCSYSDYRYYQLLYRDFIQSVEKGVIYCSAGGDNYSYNNNIWLSCLNSEIIKRGGKTVLLGCSLLDKITDSNMIADLSQYSAIITRESISYNAAKEAGIKTDLYCIPDPAFALPKVECALPPEFISGNTVGINVSPMIIGYEKNAGMTMANYQHLIEFILKETDMNVALIPHVIWEHTDDRKPLSLLYNMYNETGRICMIEDHNAEELKGYIARCRFMVAARTHASIAAYSTQVPTLVVGYSVKARGIARDIFGTEENYVVPVQSLSKENLLKDRFIWIMQNEGKIINHYRQFISGYIRQVMSMKDVISKCEKL